MSVDKSGVSVDAPLTKDNLLHAHFWLFNFLPTRNNYLSYFFSLSKRATGVAHWTPTLIDRLMENTNEMDSNNCARMHIDQRQAFPAHSRDSRSLTPSYRKAKNARFRSSKSRDHSPSPSFYVDSNKNRDSNGTPSNKQDENKDPDNGPRKSPIPVIMKPSGFLSGNLAESTLQSTKTIAVTRPSTYTPPSDQITPTANTVPRFFLYKFQIDLDTDKVINEVRIPLINHSRSYYLIGRDSEVADIDINDHVVSNEHAVIQFRKVEDENKVRTIKAYVIDLKSTNGTFLNDEKYEIPSQRFVELISGDKMKFGDYVNEYEFVFVADLIG